MVQECREQFRRFLLTFVPDEPCSRCRAKGCATCEGTGFKQSPRRFKKRPWTKEEDEALLAIVRRVGKNFVHVSREFGSGRSTQSIRERYRNHLKKDVRYK